MSAASPFAIHALELGPMENFVYLVEDRASGRAAVVDPHRLPLAVCSLPTPCPPLAPLPPCSPCSFSGAGTVSGAPKVRAMEIIDELEPEKRGVYGGGVGYFAANGDMDMCIALRTALAAGLLWVFYLLFWRRYFAINWNNLAGCVGIGIANGVG